MASYGLLFKKDVISRTKLYIINKELLAIVTVFEKWYIYVEGAVETIIYIGYKNLLLFTITKELNK